MVTKIKKQEEHDAPFIDVYDRRDQFHNLSKFKFKKLIWSLIANLSDPVAFRL